MMIKDVSYYGVFQCKVRAEAVRSPEEKEYYFIVNNPADIRPYRILLKKKDIGDMKDQE